MGAERRAKAKRRAQKTIRLELEAAILAARRAGRDEVMASAEVMAFHTGRDAESCAKEIRVWLESSPLLASSSSVAPPSSPSDGTSTPESAPQS